MNELPPLQNPKTGGPFAHVAVAFAGSGLVLLEGQEARVASLGGAITVKLPSPVSDTTIVAITDEDGDASTHHITIDGNGKNIDDAATQTLSTDFGSTVVEYSVAEGQWRRIYPDRRVDDGPVEKYGFDAAGAGAGGTAIVVPGNAGDVLTSDGAGAILAPGSLSAFTNYAKLVKGQAVKRISSAVTVLLTDADFHVTLTAANKFAQLPAAPGIDGQRFEVKARGVAGCAIDGNGQNIDGLPTYSLAVDECASVMWNVTSGEWELC